MKKSHLRRILFILSLFMGLNLSASSVLGPSIFQYQDLDNLILSPGQIYTINLQDYFAGFNLSYIPYKSSLDKFFELDSIDLATPAQIRAFSSFTNSKSSTFLLLEDPSSIYYARFNLEEGIFDRYFQVDFTSDSISYCNSIVLIDQDTAVADCYSSGQKYFYLVNLENSEPQSTINPLVYPLQSRRFMINSEGYQGSDFILYVSHRNWFISTGTIKQGRVNIQNVETYLTINDFPDLPSDFTLGGVQVLDPNTLLLAGNNKIAFVQSSQLTSIKTIAPIEEHLGTISSRIKFGINQEYTSCTIQGQFGVYEVIFDVNLTVIGTNYYSMIYGDSVFSSGQTEGFIFLTSNDTENNYLQIYQRGETNAELVFFVTYLLQQGYAASIPFIQGETNVMGLFSSRFEARRLQLPQIKLKNREDKTLNYEYPLMVRTSASDLKVSFNLTLVGANEENVLQLTDSLNFVLQMNSSLYINFQDYFSGPLLNYYIQFPNSEKAYFQGLNSIPLTAIQGEFRFLHIEEFSGALRVFLQEQYNMESLQVWDCLALYTADDPTCQLLDSMPLLHFGEVNQIYGKDLNWYFVVVSGENGENIIMKYPKNDFNQGEYVDACNVVYHSSDNLLDQNLYCTNPSTLTVFLPDQTMYIYESPIIDSVMKLLSHPYYPGILFAATTDAIIVIETQLFRPDTYPSVITTLNIEGQFDFVVSNNHLIVMVYSQNNIEDYELIDLNNIRFSRNFMLPDINIVYTASAFTYSLYTDLVYFMGDEASYPDEKFIYALDPNGQRSVLRYELELGDVDQSEVLLSVIGLDAITDLVVTITPKHSYIWEVYKYQFIIYQPQHEEIDYTQLYTILPFKLVAESCSSELALNAEIIYFNSQREITINPDSKNLELQLEYDDTSSLSFRAGQVFNGPSFYLSLFPESNLDNLELIPRVNSSKFSFQMNVISANQNSHFVVINTETELIIFNMDTFPAFDESTKRISLVPPGVENQELYIDDEYIALSGNRDYFDFIIISRINLPEQQSCMYPQAFDVSRMRIVSGFLFSLTPNSEFILQIFRIVSPNEGCLDLVAGFDNLELGIKRFEESYGFDVVQTGGIDENYFIFLSAGTRGFVLITMTPSQQFTISRLSDFQSLFAADYVDSKNLINIYSLILIDAKNENTLTYANLLLQGYERFIYNLNCIIDSNGEILVCEVLAGYILYQTYNYHPIKLVTDKYFVVVGEQFTEMMTSNIFIYELNSSFPIAAHQNQYPLYDAFEAIVNSQVGVSTMLLFNKNDTYFFYLYDDMEQNFTEYTIVENFTITTDSRHITSQWVDLVGENDIWSNDFKIPLYGYRSFMKGYGTAEIILIVFLGVIGALVILIIINRYFRFKEKRMIKDTFYEAQGYFQYHEGQTNQ